MRITQLSFGALLVTIGAVLVIANPDGESGWFRGQPLGLVLAVLGLVDLVGAVWRRDGAHRGARVLGH